MNRKVFVYTSLAIVFAMGLLRPCMAQTFNPPYPNQTFPTEADAAAACQANIPTSDAYMEQAYPVPPDTLVMSYCK